MSETNVKNDSTNVSHEQPSGNEGLEKTSGTISTSIIDRLSSVYLIKRY